MGQQLLNFGCVAGDDTPASSRELGRCSDCRNARLVHLPDEDGNPRPFAGTWARCIFRPRYVYLAPSSRCTFNPPRFEHAAQGTKAA